MLKPDADAETFRPVFYDPANAHDRSRLERLVAERRPAIHDTLWQQLAELVVTQNPAVEMSAEERARRIEAHLAGVPLERYGTWAHFPWSRRLVHLLPRDELRFVRSSRNRNKIAPREAETLREKVIGIVGLSVGMASAVTLAMEGVGGAFRLADFDRLDLSNMNRLRAGVHDIGVPKTVLAARAMFEIDPYLEVTTFSAGLDARNVDEFLTGGGQLDLLVEECDDLELKILVRERARQLRIPVVMETSDRGLLDVERFDLEPERPLLHGLVGSLSSAALRGLSTKEKVPYVLRIIGESTISPALAASLVEVKQTIATWPQLASAVALGGAVITDTARRLLLGTFRESGRFFVDLEELVSRDRAMEAPEGGPLEPAVVPEARTPRRVDAVVARPGPLTAEEARWLVAHAVLAPSGGNTQPWRFERTGGTIRAYLDGRASYLDFERRASWLALGAAAENLELAARELGLSARIEKTPDGFSATLERAPVARSELFPFVTERVTNRRIGAREPLAARDRGALIDAAAGRGTRLHLVEDEARLERLGAVLGRGDRLRFLAKPLHEELVSELRFRPDEVTSTRDGIDVATLDLPLADAAALRVVARWPAMARLRALDAGDALGDAARKAVRGSAAVALLAGDDPFPGGRALEHVWLEATSRGLALQPWAPLLYLFRRLDAGSTSGLERPDLETLRALREELRALVDWGTDAPLFLFRLAKVGPPSALSLRKRLDDVYRDLS